MTPINFEQLLDNVSQDKEFAKSLIQLYLEETPKELQKMDDYLSEEDWSGCKDIAHKVIS